MTDWSTLKKLIWMRIIKGGGSALRTVTGAIVHVTNALAMPAKALSVNVEPVQAGSGDPSPDNVRPISGWTMANFEHRNDNLFSPYYGAFNKTSTTYAGQMIGKGNSRFAVKLFDKGNNADISGCYFGVSNSGTSADGLVWLVSNGTISNTEKVTTTQRYVSIYPKTEETLNKILNRFNVQIELGSTVPSAFNGYAAATLQISWVSEIGTVYGGTLTVNEDGSADLVIDTISAIIPGQALKSIWFDQDVSRTTFGCYTGASNWESQSGLPSPTQNYSIFNYFRTGTVYNNDNAWTAGFLFTSGTFNRFEIRLPKSVLADYSNWQAALQSARDYLDEHPLQAVYKVVPTTIHFDNVGQIDMLLGENNLWADAGDSTLTYYTEGEASTSEALGILLGGTYNNPGSADDASDDEALGILLGGS